MGIGNIRGLDPGHKEPWVLTTGRGLGLANKSLVHWQQDGALVWQQRALCIGSRMGPWPGNKEPWALAAGWGLGLATKSLGHWHKEEPIGLATKSPGHWQPERASRPGHKEPKAMAA